MKNYQNNHHFTDFYAIFMNLDLPTALFSGKQVGDNTISAYFRHLLEGCSESSAES
jgi:hypothetical protein